jgi:hypothetical protein
MGVHDVGMDRPEEPAILATFPGIGTGRQFDRLDFHPAGLEPGVKSRLLTLSNHGDHPHPVASGLLSYCKGRDDALQPPGGGRGKHMDD